MRRYTEGNTGLVRHRRPAAVSHSDPQPTISRSPATVLFSREGFTPPAPAELNARIPSLEVIELLGQGGMGVVYKGRQPLLDRLVAIKVLRPDLQTDDDFQERFLREARTLAKLRHPYIVTVYDVGKSDQLYYLVMEYVEGASLRKLLVDRSISERDALEFVPQMAEALQHSHEAGVVHRDIKPENVLIDARGRVRLVDYGLATLFGPQAARNADDNRVAGTLGYMAPEQFTMPETVDHRADIYSTGVVFYEMLAGERPGADRLPPSQKAATDPRLDPIVLCALERERERRYQEARLLHSDIVALARTPETTIRVEKHIHAPAEQVFAAWTDPLQMADWYAPSDQFGPTGAEVDIQVGGQYRVSMQPPGQDQPSVVSGQYCRVDAPRSLSFTWAWESPRADTHETQVTLEFHSRGDTTDFVLIHERFRDDASRNNHAQGWQGCLDRLSRKLGG
jgi:serine/threonine protein kinase